jgi:hypothetical protein
VLAGAGRALRQRAATQEAGDAEDAAGGFNEKALNIIMKHFKVYGIFQISKAKNDGYKKYPNWNLY